MRDINEFHAATWLLDVVGANPVHFVFTTQEQFNKDYGFIISIQYPAIESRIPNIINSEIPMIASIEFDNYTFIFIDPKDIPMPKNKTPNT